MYAQEPGANQDFGKYSKQPSFDTNFLASGTFMLALINPIQKLPKDKNWIQFEEESTDLKQIAGITLHPSRAFLGDTTSVSYQGEYIEHHPNPYFSDVAPVCFYSDLVTNKEWNVFRAYVRDSMARMILANEMDFDLWANYGLDEITAQEKDESDWVLDWNKSTLDWRNWYKNKQYKHLCELFYFDPVYKRFENQINETKLNYEYYENNYKSCKTIEGSVNSLKNKNHRALCWNKEIVSIFRDSILWIKDTSFTHSNSIEDGLCQFYNYHPYFEKNPVNCINSPQARSYLKWSEVNHQKKLDNDNLPYKVIYELPSYQLDTINLDLSISSFDLDSWRITNKEYEIFVHFVRDSIAIRLASFEYGIEPFLIDIDFNNLEPLSDCLYPINKKIRFDWKRKSFKPIKWHQINYTFPNDLLNEMFYTTIESDSNLIDKRNLIMVQNYFDFKTAAKMFKVNPSNRFDDGCENCAEKYYLENRNQLTNNFKDTSHYIGKDLNLSFIDNKNESTDTYAHNDKARFITKDLINIYPGINYKNCKEYYELKYGCNQEENMSIKTIYVDALCPEDLNYSKIPNEYDFKSQPKTLIQDITYDQFLAYWRWRIEKGKLPNDNENPVISHYIPSEEEFFKIQAGENIMHQSEIHALPTPSFRYVVKFYPKND